MESITNRDHRESWNKGKTRDLALFNLGIDSKLRGCDLVALRVRDICHSDQVATRAVVMQHKTQRPVQFEITSAMRDAVQKWIKQAGLKSEDFLFPSRIHGSPHLGTRKYARIVDGWVKDLGLVPVFCVSTFISIRLPEGSSRRSSLVLEHKGARC